jgi:hemin uptake protein HemP
MAERPQSEQDSDVGAPAAPDVSVGDVTATPTRPLPKIISFSSLVKCGDEVWIEHGGSLYRLRRTKQDKLILTK